MDQDGGLVVEHRGVTFDGGLVEPSSGQATVGPPVKFVRLD